MLNTPVSDQTCSSSPISGRLGSALKVVLPVPDNPKSTLLRPVAGSAVAEQCMDRCPFRGIRWFITVKMPFFISPAYSVPKITICCLARSTSTLVRLVMPEVSGLAGKAPALKIVQSGTPNSADSCSVGRISIVHMNSAWYGRSHTTRTLMRCSGSHPAKASTTYRRGRVAR